MLAKYYPRNDHEEGGNRLICHINLQPLVFPYYTASGLQIEAGLVDKLLSLNTHPDGGPFSKRDFEYLSAKCASVAEHRKEKEQEIYRNQDSLILGIVSGSFGFAVFSSIAVFITMPMLLVFSPLVFLTLSFLGYGISNFFMQPIYDPAPAASAAKLIEQAERFLPAFSNTARIIKLLAPVVEENNVEINKPLANPPAPIYKNEKQEKINLWLNRIEHKLHKPQEQIPAAPGGPKV